VEAPGYGHYSLTNSDYYLVLPERVSDWHLGTYLSESSGDFSNRLEYLHTSSQLGDGFFTTIQGFPSTQESFRYTRPTSLRNGSGFTPAGVFTPRRFRGGTFLLARGDELYSPIRIFSSPRRGAVISPMTSRPARTWRGLQPKLFGGPAMEVEKGNPSAVRLALLYYNGNSNYGQFYRENDDHWTWAFLRPVMCKTIEMREDESFDRTRALLKSRRATNVKKRVRHETCFNSSSGWNLKLIN